MKFDPKDFKVALWTNTDRRSDKAPTHQGQAKFGSFIVPVVCWYDESPENRRPNITIQVNRGYVMPSDKDDLQGDNAVDHNKIETDRSARLDQMEKDLEAKLDQLDRILEKAVEEAA